MATAVVYLGGCSFLIRRLGRASAVVAGPAVAWAGQEAALATAVVYLGGCSFLVRRGWAGGGLAGGSVFCGIHSFCFTGTVFIMVDAVSCHRKD